MSKTEKILLEIHKRIAVVGSGINFFIVRHSLRPPTALRYAAELRDVADRLEELVRDARNDKDQHDRGRGH